MNEFNMDNLTYNTKIVDVVDIFYENIHPEWGEEYAAVEE